ncbi:unnamed protein product, partial [Ectocarpus sp. 12 AP-2014]
MHRVCNPCIAEKQRQKQKQPEKQKTPGSSNQPKRPSPGSGFLRDGAAAKKKKPGDKGGPRKRLNFGQQLEILKLLDDRVTYAEIGRRCGISSSGIGLIKIKREQLLQEAATNARSMTSKSSRSGEFPE